MHPLSAITLAISGTVLFVSTVLLTTQTPVPFFEQAEEPEIEFQISGLSGNLSFIQAEADPISGWAVFTFGEYLDDDENELWDGCESFEMTIWNISEEDAQGNDLQYFYPICDLGSERTEIEDMIYVGQVCYDPSNYSSPKCVEGNYSFESSHYARLTYESVQGKESFKSKIIDWIKSGLSTGRTFLCGSLMIMVMGLFSTLVLKESEEVDITKKESTGAEWRAYSLSQTERGDDGLPKAFSRHVSTKDAYRKPRKGNTRGGVHKTGGLFLDGWTSEDSNKEYKKKVEDKRRN
ncbi:MAG: hypothetical protein CMB67_05270 [Euryarchaeota archaeon]|nr:hypothetical protein [Euryarchaeota archaeon]|tara:strand:+ start:392 stop:1270 length:879 start_codon:yes stop_codon:yes gene_type:complete